MNALTKRQWMVTHEWMVKPMRQTEWIDGKGMMVWLAEVFSALGSGLYLIGIIANSWWASLFGWLGIMLFKFPLHLFYLGKPQRFWRAFPPFSKAWRTSWFSRGVVFTTIFVAFGTLQLIFGGLIHWEAVSGGTADLINVLDWICMFIAGVFIILTGVYCGFAMSFCKSVPFWNTGLLPLIFLIVGAADGLALATGTALVTDSKDGMWLGHPNSASIETLEHYGLIAVIISVVLIIAYLINANYQSTTAELSVRELIKGKVAAVFWLGLITLGLVVPLAISIVGLATGEHQEALLIVATICHTIGAFCLKYGVLKVGIYRPLLPKVSAY